MTHTDIHPKHKGSAINSDYINNSGKRTVSHTAGQQQCVNIFKWLKGNQRANTSP